VIVGTRDKDAFTSWLHGRVLGQDFPTASSVPHERLRL
jgi:hypothetical protein